MPWLPISLDYKMGKPPIFFVKGVVQRQFFGKEVWCSVSNRMVNKLWFNFPLFFESQWSFLLREIFYSLRPITLSFHKSRMGLTEFVPLAHWIFWWHILRESERSFGSEKYRSFGIGANIGWCLTRGEKGLFTFCDCEGQFLIQKDTRLKKDR